MGMEENMIVGYGILWDGEESFGNHRFLREIQEVIQFEYNTKEKDWNLDTGYTLPIAFMDQHNNEYGVRFGEINGDGFPDIVKSVRYESGVEVRQVYINNGIVTGKQIGRAHV